MHDLSGGFSILIIEDQEIDADYFAKAIQKVLPTATVDIFEEGDSAINHINNVANEAIHPLPNLILLDLNLPVKSGFDILEEIRGDPRLMAIPVIIVSTSASRRDIQKAYRMKANAFVRKPEDITGYGEIANAISVFWHKIALYP